ncbi:MAG: hypothetical protein KA284_13930 [Bacteroidia bacterium]|nr:hypothetical protein [Bacteroidota bacterium]MBP6658954.1 hypothetical protein [Bacteroidia bacterium]
MNKVFQIIIRFSTLLILVLTYLYVTRAKPISSIDQINICKLDQKLTLDSRESAQYISKVEEFITGDTLKLVVFRKSISFVQSGPYHYDVKLDSGIKVVQILDSDLLVGEIEKCIE